jgi:TonB family protein
MKHLLLLLGLTLANAPLSAPAQTDATISDSDMRVVDFQELKYPAIAVNSPGVVVVRLALDERGKVTSARVLSGDPFLIPSVVENTKTWRFEPNSQKAAIVVYNFRIEGFCLADKFSSQMIFYPPNFVTVIGCARSARE